LSRQKSPGTIQEVGVNGILKSEFVSLVNVSSVNGIWPAAFQGVYSITKGALITMTVGIRQGAGTPANPCQRPAAGIYGHPVLVGAQTEQKDLRNGHRQIPLRRHADPAEMAGAVLYLVSDAASYTTDACLTCDGGLLA